MQTLCPGRWLNDEVNYIRICLAKRDENNCTRSSNRIRRSHFFNSFFVQNLFDGENNDLEKRGKYKHDKVCRWSRQVPGRDIFHLKYIFAPINKGNTHWTLAVTFVEDKRIQYYDSMGGTEMDKLVGLLKYVKDEYRKHNN
jgi:sentrin-specific protease 1